MDWLNGFGENCKFWELADKPCDVVGKPKLNIMLPEKDVF